jgi:hypothetical protein
MITIRLLLAAAAIFAAIMASRIDALAQQAVQPQPAAPLTTRTPRATAPIDLTGYWVSIVNEDWRWRMMTPAKGDYASVPLNDAGRKAADAWDFAQDQASGNVCKPFGVGNIMRMPGRLHITWQDDKTLKIEADAGTQTRLLHFDGRQAAGERTWQGHSLASWELAGRQRDVDRNAIPISPTAGGRGRGRGVPARTSGNQGDGAVITDDSRPAGGSLKVVTAHMRAGHLRKNGVPYSENASVSEHFDRLSYPNGDVILIVRTVVEDPMYLDLPFITSSNFKLERDGSKWKPTPCAIDPPVVRPHP